VVPYFESATNGAAGSQQRIEPRPLFGLDVLARLTLPAPFSLLKVRRPPPPCNRWDWWQSHHKVKQGGRKTD
jgi:hypothetical protein